MVLYLLCDLELWHWPWIFKVNFWKCCISGMGGPIDMEPNGRESMGYQTPLVTLNFDLTHELDLGFSRSNFEIAVSREGRAGQHETKGIWVSRMLYLIWDLELRMWVDRMLDPSCDFKLWPDPMTFNFDFQGQIFNSHILGIGRSIDLEWNRCELDTMLDA